MKQLAVIGIVGVSLTGAALAGNVHRATGVSSPNAARCGGTLWRMKTFSDKKRNTVALNAKTTTIEALRDLSPPKRLPRTRQTAFQKQVWEVVAQIASYRRDTTELRLVLFDHGTYMSAAIPSPSCLSASTRNRNAIIAAWNAFGSLCGHGTDTWQPLGAIAYVRGVGFWTRPGVHRGTPPNGAELHPVTGLRVVAGCGG